MFLLAKETLVDQSVCKGIERPQPSWSRCELCERRVDAAVSRNRLRLRLAARSPCRPSPLEGRTPGRISR